MTDRLQEPGIVVDLFGRFRVGRCIFDTREEAERALREIPAPRARKKKAPRIPPLDSRRLTLPERGVTLRDAQGRDVIGCIIRVPPGLFVLWLGRRRVGEFETREEAEAAARQAKPWRPAP